MPNENLDPKQKSAHEDAWQRTLASYREAGDQLDRDLEKQMRFFGKSVMAIFIGVSAYTLSNAYLYSLDKTPEILKIVFTTIDSLEKNSK